MAPFEGPLINSYRGFDVRFCSREFLEKHAIGKIPPEYMGIIGAWPVGCPRYYPSYYVRVTFPLAPSFEERVRVLKLRLEFCLFRLREIIDRYDAVPYPV